MQADAMITILTSTYNRAHTLRRLFQSLCDQTASGFEWLVVDDGSTDDTAGLMKELTAEDRFHVRYIRQENSGKHVALNTGSELARGNWILILDSDDALTPDAISTVHKVINEKGNAGVVGFCFRRSYFNGMLVGNRLETYSEVNLHPTEAAKILAGDLAYVFRRQAMCSNPFPVIPGEKFVPELYIWNKIADGGQILYLTNKVIYLCEYLDDGYSKNFKSNLKINPKGFLVFYRAQFHRETTIIQKLKCGIRSMQCLTYAFFNGLRS